MVVEELVNYAGTTANAAEEFRAAGYPVSHAACILSYNHAQSNSKLKEKIPASPKIRRTKAGIIKPKSILKNCLVIYSKNLK